MLLEDLSSLDSSEYHKKQEWACEEIYLSTYGYNYAKTHGIEVSLVEVVIDWNRGYEVSRKSRIEELRHYGYGSGVCKLSDNVKDEVRLYL